MTARKTDKALLVRMKKLRIIHPQEIGGRAGEIADLLAELVETRKQVRALQKAFGFVWKIKNDGTPTNL